jgi:hypothetical protein
VPSDRIEKHRYLPLGMANQPEALEELETRRAQHARLIAGKPDRPFNDILEEKLHGKKEKKEEDEGEQEPGAKDPLLGLSPGQSPALAKNSKGRRAGRVIVKG